MRLVHCTKHIVQFSGPVMHFGCYLDNPRSSDVHAQGASIPEHKYYRSTWGGLCGCGVLDVDLTRAIPAVCAGDGAGDGFGPASSHPLKSPGPENSSASR